LETLVKELPAGRRMAVCRELTKIYESVVRGDSQTIRDYFLNNPDKIKGEFVVIVSAK